MFQRGHRSCVRWLDNLSGYLLSWLIDMLRHLRVKAEAVVDVLWGDSVLSLVKFVGHKGYSFLDLALDWHLIRG